MTRLGRLSRKTLPAILPGLLLLIGGAVLATGLEALTGMNRLVLAIVLGFALANTIGVPRIMARGVATYSVWLVIGIVLMGALVSLDTIIGLGPVLLLVVIVIPAATLLLVEFLARTMFGLGGPLGSLLAAGASICGVSAIIGVASVVRPAEEHIAYATATILLFDAITIVAYPIIGTAIGIPDPVFGIWAGISMFSTGPVIAVGFAHSPVAGQWATLTKLARNALLGLVILGYATMYAQKRSGPSSGLRAAWENFPKFIVGFLALMLLSSAGVFSETHREAFEMTYSWLFTVSFVGLGTNLRFSELRNAGIAPGLLILVTFLLVSSFSLLALMLIL